MRRPWSNTPREESCCFLKRFYLTQRLAFQSYLDIQFYGMNCIPSAVRPSLLFAKLTHQPTETLTIKPGLSSLSFSSQPWKPLSGADSLCCIAEANTTLRRRKWQPTPVFLPGESQGRRSLVGCRLWGHTESDTTEATWQQQQHNIVKQLYSK